MNKGDSVGITHRGVASIEAKGTFAYRVEQDQGYKAKLLIVCHTNAKSLPRPLGTCLPKTDYLGSK